MPTLHVRPSSQDELQSIADTVGRSRKVVVITGAGISTNCGIPDFRSENGLYSMIQAQYDAALQNPPWEEEDSDDIDDRPKKRRKPGYYYEIVAPCGEVVDIVDDLEDDSTHETQSSSRSTSVVNNRSSSSRATSPETTSLEDNTSRKELPTNGVVVSERLAYGQKDTSTPARPSSRHVEISPSTASDILSSPPQSPSSSQSSQPTQSKPATSMVIEIPTNASKQAMLLRDYTPSGPAKPRSSTALKRKESTLSTSEDEEPSTQSSQISRTALPNLKGRDLFDAMIWSEAFTTSIFYMFISTLRQKVSEVRETSETHKFIKMLRDGGRLVRNYTQNIDRLEEKEGLTTNLVEGPGNRARFHSKTQKEARPTEIDKDSVHCGGVEVVYLHGSLDKLRCGICAKLSDWDEAREAVTLAGRAPDCPSCEDYSAKRTGRGRRSLAVGRLRPDIVLYGEEHPQSSLISPLVTHDLGLGPDVLLIMGTSLRVHGLKVMVREFAKAVHTKGGKVVFVNNTKPSESQWGDVIDYWVEWDCDAWVRDLKYRRDDIWLPQGSVNPRRESLNVVKVQKPVNRTREKRVDPPGYTRDDKLCGVYVTFKILDQLRELKGEGDEECCQRKQYRKIRPLPQTYVNPNIAVIIDSRSTPATPNTVPSKQKQTKNVAPAKKRKSLPAKVPPKPATKSTSDGRNYNAQVVINSTWEDLRRNHPSLSVLPPPISPGILYQRCQNIPTTEHKFMAQARSNYLPNLFYGMGLDSHPPSDPQAAAMVRAKSTKVVKPPPPPTNHTYGTRSSRIALAETTAPNRVPALERNPFKHNFAATEQDKQNRPPLTPPPSNPCSDPPSDCDRRIKRLGSIETILSPSRPLQEDEEMDSDQSQVFYDAQETPS